MRLLTILILLPVIGLAQLNGEWISHDQSNTKKKMVITEGWMIMYSFGYTDVPENAKWNAYDSIPVESIDTDVLVIGNKKGGDGYSAAKYTLSNNGSILTLAKLRKGYPTIDEATKAANEYAYVDLTGEQYYTPSFNAKLENRKSLDELTKPDLISVIQRLQAYDKDIEGLINEDNRMQRMIFYFTQRIMNRSFIELGYNPYKMTEGWFYKRFMDDPDIKKMMDKQIHLKLN